MLLIVTCNSIVYFLHCKANVIDTVIYSVDKDLRMAHYRMQLELDNILKWCNQNQLTINSKKPK